MAKMMVIMVAALPYVMNDYVIGEGPGAWSLFVQRLFAFFAF